MAAIPNFTVFSPERESWDSFMEHFECFLLAQEFKELTTDRRGYFLSACGPEMFSTARALAAPVPLHSIPWETLIVKLRNHYTLTPSRIARRHAFCQCTQHEGETISQYMASLRAAAIPCEFRELDDALVEQLVCGVRDLRLQCHLLARSDLTLQTAIDEARAAELADKSAAEIQRY